MFLRKPKKAFPSGKGDHEVVDEGNLYHRLYGIRYQFYVLQICSVSRVVEGADPYDGTIYFERSRGTLCCRKATYRAAGISHTKYISQIRRIYIAGCVAVGFCVAVRLHGASRVSLRLGRSAALTTHCVVIHYRLNRRALHRCRIFLWKNNGRPMTAPTRLPYVFTEAEESLPF